jgi:K+-transporting ATPase KdpF subunit
VTHLDVGMLLLTIGLGMYLLVALLAPDKFQ